jgi:fumarate hydratase class II
MTATDHDTRIETDSLGEVDVASDVLWGAQTQRSLKNFAIGDETMPRPIVRALGLQKKSAALANMELGLLDRKIGEAVVQAADEIIDGRLNDQFPLSIWQTGSGTQTNMNANEVIANRAIDILGGRIGSKDPVHPNDHVNMGQSSNDTFPTVMHIAIAEQLHHELIPAIQTAHQACANKSDEFGDVVKIGRTHLQDATPVTLGQEFSAYRDQLSDALDRITDDLDQILPVAQGGTAVGTGLNAHPDFANRFAHHLARLTDLNFTSMDNKFTGLGCHDPITYLHGDLNTLATAAFKMANDIRLMGSGPRCGIGEIQLPANEPGSSIMPGKVNPTQAEALTMIATQIMGNQTTISIANSQGHLELNVFKPVIAHNVLQSIRLLTDGLRSFTTNCLIGITVNEKKVAEYLNNSLMLVTVLAPEIGYDAAAEAAKKAHEDKTSLKQAVIDLNLLDADRFDDIVDPAKMV